MIAIVQYVTVDTFRGALFEVIRKVACAQISNMRMVLREMKSAVMRILFYFFLIIND
jgi:hypothetical protein